MSKLSGAEIVALIIGNSAIIAIVLIILIMKSCHIEEMRIQKQTIEATSDERL